MPLSISMTDDGGLLIEAHGTITDADLQVGNDALYNDVALTKRLRYQLMDVSGAERIDISSEQLARAGEADRKALAINPHMRIAVVVSRDVAYGIARIWRAYADMHADQSDSFRIFKSRKEAHDWIEGPRPSVSKP